MRLKVLPMADYLEQRSAQVYAGLKAAGNKNGLIIYDGPSLFNNDSIVAIATGFEKSKNRKTGNMLQVWILVKAESPIDAIEAGTSVAVCGDCKHHRFNSCYVAVHQAPLAVWRAWKAGRYPMANSSHLPLFVGHKIRLGAYGDPAAVPVSIWRSICSVAAGHTAYTHAWRNPAAAEHQRYCMASCDTSAEVAEARAAGWKPFYVRGIAEPLPADSFECPASELAGHRLNCDRCMACSGGEHRPGQATPSIEIHGTAGKIANFQRGMAAMAR